MNCHSYKAVVLAPSWKQAHPNVRIIPHQTRVYSRPLKNYGHKCFITKVNREGWGIIVNHFFVNKPFSLVTNQVKIQVLYPTTFAWWFQELWEVLSHGKNGSVFYLGYILYYCWWWRGGPLWRWSPPPSSSAPWWRWGWGLNGRPHGRRLLRSLQVAIGRHLATRRRGSSVPWQD